MQCMVTLRIVLSVAVAGAYAVTDGKGKDCQWLTTHTFEVVDSVATFLLSAEIRETGLTIDIMFEDRRSDRMYFLPNQSQIISYDNTNTETDYINYQLNEGFQDISGSVVSNILSVESTSSEMAPVLFKPKSKIKSIKVSAAEDFRICKESCSIVKNIHKNLLKQDTYNITAFITSKDTISFKIDNSIKAKEIWEFEIKPKDCLHKRNHENISIPCNHIKQGWNKLTVFINDTTLSINNNITLPLYNGMKTLSISGSYLVDCIKGNPVWNISSKEVPVPISLAEDTILSLSSTVAFIPVLNLNGVKLPLNWNNGLNFGTSGKALQPQNYNFKLNKTSDVLIVMVYNEEKKDVLMEMKMKKVPESIRVSSLKGEYFFTLSVNDQSQKLPTLVDTEPTPVNIAFSNSDNTAITWNSWTVGAFIIIIIFIFIIIFKIT